MKYLKIYEHFNLKNEIYNIFMYLEDMGFTVVVSDKSNIRISSFVIRIDKLEQNDYTFTIDDIKDELLTGIKFVEEELGLYVTNFLVSKGEPNKLSRTDYDELDDIPKFDKIVKLKIDVSR